jgi:outer membrane protein TolC
MSDCQRRFWSRSGFPPRPIRAGWLLTISLFLLGCRSGEFLPEKTNRPEAAQVQSPVVAAKTKAPEWEIARVGFSAQEPRPAERGDPDTVVLPAIDLTPAVTPIGLPSALRLAGADNPTIALAEEAVRAALADQLRADSLLLPDLTGGFNYNLHFGLLQSSIGIMREVDREALYAGAGAAAIGAGTVGFPGVRLTAHLGDAFLEPRAARRRVTGRRFDAVATRHTLLLDVANRYLELQGAQARLLALRQSESDLKTSENLTLAFARTGFGRMGDAERARTELLLLQNAIRHMEEETDVQSAELARLLSIDPSLRLRADDGAPGLMQLVDPGEPLERLIQNALANRPEVAARSADVEVLATRLRQEQVRPFVPVVSVGFSSGEFGGGSNLVPQRFGNFAGRTDFDALAVWTFQNLGLGNLAVQRRVRAELRQATAERMRVVDVIRREVAEAYALVRQRQADVEIARKRIDTSQEAYRLDLERTRNFLGRPIEVINSANLLTAARQDLVGAVIGFNQAQFQLFVAVGQPPTAALTTPAECSNP